MSMTKRFVYAALALALLVLTGSPFAFDATAQDGGALLQDDFSDPASGWDSFDLTGCRAAYEGGAFRLAVDGDWRWCYARLFPNDPAWFLGDAALDIDVTAQSAAGYAGVAFRLADQYRFYAFVVRPSTNQYALWRSDGPRTGWVGLVDWAALPADVPGTVRLGVTMQGSAFTLAADGTALATIQDGTLAGGWLALIAGRSDDEAAAGQAAAFTFDNAQLRQPATGSLAPRNDRIVFYTEAGAGGGSEIFTVRPDGSDLRQLTANTADDWYPAWSPDGQQIAFYSDRDGNGEIYVMNADGSAAQRLTVDSAEDDAPDWSPDGQQIVFSSERGGRRDIYVMNADGSDFRPLTADAAPDYNPTWSPDGTQIAFISSRDGAFEIYLMNADGSNIRRLTDNAYREWGAAWSPDGGRLAFHADPTFSGSNDLYLLDVAGGEPVMITEGARDERFPAWSPDGTQIVFMSDYDGDYELYILQVDAPPGRPYRQVTVNAAADWWPDWTAGDTTLPPAWAASPPGGVTPTCLAISSDGDDLNLRGGPGTAYPVVGTLRGDQPLPVIGYRGNWYALTVDDQQGWVAGWLVGLSGTCDSLVYVLLPGETLPGASTGPGETPQAPTPTLQPGAPVVSFTADGRSTVYLAPGECADIAWKVSNASEAYYQDRPVSLQGATFECPGDKPGSYVYGLRVINPAGTFTYGVTLVIEQPEGPPGEPCYNPSGVCINISVNGARYQEVCPGGSVNISWKAWGFVDLVYYNGPGGQQLVGREGGTAETLGTEIGAEYEFCIYAFSGQGEDEACVYAQVIDCP